MKGANGEPVYVLLDEGDEIDPETANQLSASVAAGDFDRAKPEIRNSKSTTVPAAGVTTDTVDICDKNVVAAKPSEVSHLNYCSFTKKRKYFHCVTSALSSIRIISV